MLLVCGQGAGFESLASLAIDDDDVLWPRSWRTSSPHLTVSSSTFPTGKGCDWSKFRQRPRLFRCGSPGGSSGAVGPPRCLSHASAPPTMPEYWGASSQSRRRRRHRAPLDPPQSTTSVCSPGFACPRCGYDPHFSSTTLSSHESTPSRPDPRSNSVSQLACKPTFIILTISPLAASSACNETVLQCSSPPCLLSSPRHVAVTRHPGCEERRAEVDLSPQRHSVWAPSQLPVSFQSQLPSCPFSLWRGQAPNGNPHRPQPNERVRL